MTTTKSRAFTLVEMLIVIGIIVLIIMVAIPTFKSLTGGRSVEAASNNVNAILGRARTEAIGQQKLCGVLFLLDPATDRVSCYVVQDAGPPYYPPTSGSDADYQPEAGHVYLDLTDPTQSILLPNGVGLQTLDDDLNPDNNLLPTDGFIGYNDVHFTSAPVRNYTPIMYVYSEENGTHAETTLPAKVGGVILYDSLGRIASRNWRLKLSTGTAPTAMHKLLRQDQDGNYSKSIADGRPGRGSTDPRYINISDPKSGIGLVLFDRQDFLANLTLPASQTFGNDLDFQFDGANRPASEGNEEDWLKKYGLMYYVNRYNGTLVKAE